MVWYSKYGAPRSQNPNFYAYQQSTGFIGYLQELNENTNADYNHRNYGGEGYTDFRSHAAAIAAYVIYRTK